MDPRIQAGIIAFVAAVVATAIAGVINYKIEASKNKRARREETLKSLYLLKTMISFHKVDMHSGLGAVESFNNNYDAANLLIADIKMSLSLYFEKHEKDFDPVIEEAAYYWKMYKDHLISERRDYDRENSPFQRALQASMTCTKVLERMMEGLRK